MTFANLSALSNPHAAVLPAGTAAQTAGSQAKLEQPQDFVKLFESLIAREVTPQSPTQIHDQDGIESNGPKRQKNPKDLRDSANSNDQQGDGLLAMMAAPSLVPIKPAPTHGLSLNIGRSDLTEDSFVKSGAPTGEEGTVSQIEDYVHQPILPFVLQPAPLPVRPESLQGCAVPAVLGTPSQTLPSVQLEKPTFEPAREPAPSAKEAPAGEPAPLPAPVPADAQSSAITVAIPAPLTIVPKVQVPDRSRQLQELSSGARQAPALPPALGGVRTDAPPTAEPIAFVAHLIEREEPEEPQTAKPVTLPPRDQKLPALPQATHSEPAAKASTESVPTNPKPLTPAAPGERTSDPLTAKAKPIPLEKPTENVPTNPKAVATVTLPAREAPSLKTATSSPEVKQPAPTQETELQPKPAVRSEPAREISIRIPSTGGSGNVDVQIVERDGKVQVTVRGSDNKLNSALRSDLTELVHTLEQKGYKTETWTPADTYPLTSSRDPEVLGMARSESSPDWSGNQQSGADQGNPGGNQQQRRQQERPAWLIELERRLETEG